AARPRLASPVGRHPRRPAELFRGSVTGASQQTNTLGQPPLFSLHQKDRCLDNPSDQIEAAKSHFHPTRPIPAGLAGVRCGSNSLINTGGILPTGIGAEQTSTRNTPNFRSAPFSAVGV